MLNKNDPLIGAVQEVMKRNQTEREAAKIVNEKFGIEDRKALPHEKQGAWDAAYKQVLAEATDPSNYSNKQKRFAATAGNPRKIDSADLAHVRKHGGKHIEEEQLEEKKMSDAQMKKREEIVKSMKKGASGFKKRYGERAKDVMYATATKQAMNEAGGAAGGMVDYYQKKAKQDAAQKKTVDAKAPGMGGPNYNPNKSLNAKAPGMGGPNYNPNKSLNAKAPGMGGPNYVPNKGIDKAAPKPKVKPVASAPKAAAPKAKAPKARVKTEKEPSSFQRREARQRVLSGKEGVGPEANRLRKISGVKLGVTVKQPARKSLKEQIADIIAQRIDEIVVNPNNDTPAGRAYKQTLQKKGAGAPLQAGQKWNAPNRSMGSDPTNTAKGTRVAAGPKAAPALDPTRNASLDQPATKSPMAAALNRQDLAKSVKAGRVGDPGKQNFIQNARAQKEREKAAGGDGTKYLPVPPNVQKAVKDNQPVPGRPQTLSPGANPPAVSKNMSGGGGDYRKAQASPIKVSDTEVMNDPKFKKALSDVGGTQAAKKVQIGQRVAGLGRMNKGDTIMSRVRTDIAARKNVGREL
jgi:hypothetical protein